MKLSLERRIALGFGAALFVLLLVTGAAYWNAKRFMSTQYWVEHTRETLSRLEQSLTDLMSMQASTRGFVLTGHDDVLEPFNSGSGRMADSMEELKKLVGDNPAQRERIDRLVPLANRAREIMLGRIADRRARGLEAAKETSAYLEGQRAVEDVRRIIRAMVAEERRLLDDRLRRATAVGRLTVLTIMAGCVLAVVFVLLAAKRVQRELRHRREAEAAMHESFARVEDLYNNAPCGYHSLDREGRIVAMNATALAWLGYASEEVIGRLRFTQLLTPASARAFNEWFAGFIQSGKDPGVEYEMVRKDGTHLPVQSHSTAIFDAKGAYVTSRSSIYDITDRKRAAQVHLQFRALFESLPGLYLVLSPDWKIVAVSDAYLAATMTKRDDILGRGLFEIFTGNPDDPADTGPTNLRNSLLRVRETSAPDTMAIQKYDVRRPDGTFEERYWSPVNSPVFGIDRQLEYIIHRVEDVTTFVRQKDASPGKEAGWQARMEHLEAEIFASSQKIQGANEQLRAVNAELEAFSYSVSHDLRAPLRHINGFASLLAKRATNLDTESQRYLSTISTAANRMGALIDDLLAFSRIGRAPLRFEPVDHNQLIAGVMAERRYETNGHPIAWEIAPLPNVNADASMLRQVWCNLLDNAVKYSGKSPHPRIVIQSRLDPNTHEQIFSVQDNGVGFDMAYADKLFGVFQRLHGPSEFEGTGIGLANVRRIINRHGGRTWAEGKLDEGATFYFSLPLRAGAKGIMPTFSSSPVASPVREKSQAQRLRGQFPVSPPLPYPFFPSASSRP